MELLYRCCSSGDTFEDGSGLCSGILHVASAADEASIIQLVNLEDNLETPYVPACTKLIEEYMQHRFKLSAT